MRGYVLVIGGERMSNEANEIIVKEMHKYIPQSKSFSLYDS